MGTAVVSLWQLHVSMRMGALSTVIKSLHDIRLRALGRGDEKNRNGYVIALLGWEAFQFANKIRLLVLLLAPNFQQLRHNHGNCLGEISLRDRNAGNLSRLSHLYNQFAESITDIANILEVLSITS